MSHRKNSEKPESCPAIDFPAIQPLSISLLSSPRQSGALLNSSSNSFRRTIKTGLNPSLQLQIATPGFLIQWRHILGLDR